MIAELIAWTFTLALGVGPSILYAGSGHPYLAWVSAIFSAIFLFGLWYLPTRRIEWIGRTKVQVPMLLHEWVFVLVGAVGWLSCWVYLLG